MADDIGELFKTEDEYQGWIGRDKQPSIRVSWDTYYQHYPVSFPFLRDVPHTVVTSNTMPLGEDGFEELQRLRAQGALG